MHNCLRVRWKQDVPHWFHSRELLQPLLHLASLAKHALRSLAHHAGQRISLEGLLLGPGWFAFLRLRNVLLLQIVKGGERGFLREPASIFFVLPLLDTISGTLLDHFSKVEQLLSKLTLGSR